MWNVNVVILCRGKKPPPPPQKKKTVLGTLHSDGKLQKAIKAEEKGERSPTVLVSAITVLSLCLSRGCCVPPKKRGEEARSHSTVRGAPQNGDGRVEADFAIMLSRITKFVFFERGAKNFRKGGKCTKKNQKKIRATRSRLVYRDDAEGDWASRCRRRESTSRRQAKKLQPLRKPLSASV